MAVRVARTVREHCRADNMPPPEPLGRKSQTVEITGANLARTKCEDKRLRLVGRLLRKGADATAVARVLAALRVEALDEWLSTWRQLHREISDQVSERDPQQRERVRRLRLALKLAEECIRLFDQSAAGILRCLGGPPRLMLETINEINKAHRYEAKSPEERLQEVMVTVARIAIERCRAYSLPVPEQFREVLTEEEQDLILGRKPQAVEARDADPPANAKCVDSTVPSKVPQEAPGDMDKEKKGEGE